MAAARPPLRTPVSSVRETAILACTNRLLAEKGFDLMTMDQVAAAAGLSKASLYKHFASKDELAAAAMVRVLANAQVLMASLEAEGLAPAVQRLRAVVRWTLQVQLDGDMPALPSQNSSLRAALMAHPGYMARLVAVSDKLGDWITQAQAAGHIDPQLPPEVVLYTLFARGCDPVLGVLKASGSYSDERIVGLLLQTCFSGLSVP